MKFQPKSADEIAREKLLPAGDYSFVVSQATEKVSKTGNDMIEVLLRVFKDDGSFVLITDWLMEKMAHKLRHFCEATNLLEKYEQGTLEAHDLVEKTGKLKLVIQEDKTGAYDPKNSVKDYIVGDATIPTKNAKAGTVGEVIEDQIPF